MSQRNIRRLPLLIALLAMSLSAIPAGAALVTFSHEAPEASAVFVAGESNNWSDSASPMVNKDGVWSLAMDLAEGSYQ